MAEEHIRVRVVSVEEKTKTGVFDKDQINFTLEVTTPLGQVWQVRRELQEIRNLQDRLRKLFGKNTPTLPAGTAFFNQKTADQKKQLLEQFLEQCIKHPQIVESNDWVSFLIRSVRDLFSPRKGDSKERPSIIVNSPPPLNSSTSSSSLVSPLSPNPSTLSTSATSLDPSGTSATTGTTASPPASPTDKKRDISSPPVSPTVADLDVPHKSTSPVPSSSSLVHRFDSSSSTSNSSLPQLFLDALQQQNRQFVDALSQQRREFVQQNEKILFNLNQQREDFLKFLSSFTPSTSSSPSSPSPQRSTGLIVGTCPATLGGPHSSSLPCSFCGSGAHQGSEMQHKPRHGSVNTDPRGTSTQISSKQKFQDFLDSIEDDEETVVSDWWDRDFFSGVRQFATDVQVQSQALNIIASLTEDSEDNQRFILTNAGPELILDAISKFPKHEEVLEPGYKAIAHLLQTPDSDSSIEHSKHIFAKRGAIGLVSSVFRDQSSASLPLVQAALQALTQLAVNTTSCQTIIQNNFINNLLKFIEKYKESTEFISIVVNFISTLSANGGSEIQLVLGEKGLIGIIIQFLQKYSKTLDHSTALWGLSSLAEHTHNRDLLNKEKGLEFGLHVLENSEISSLSQTHIYALRLIGLMCKGNQSNQTQFLSSNGLSLLLKLLSVASAFLTSHDSKAKVPVSDPEIVQQIIAQALVTLAIVVQTLPLAKQFVEQAGPDLIISILKKIPEYEELCGALWAVREVIQDQASNIFLSLTLYPETQTFVTRVLDENPLLTLPDSLGWVYCQDCQRLVLPLCSVHGSMTELKENTFKCTSCDEKVSTVPFPHTNTNCDPSHLHSKVVRVEDSELQFLISELDKTKTGSLLFGSIYCNSCQRLEIPSACAHGLLTKSDGKGLSCSTCSFQTQNTAPWNNGCRWCQSPITVQINNLEDLSKLKDIQTRFDHLRKKGQIKKARRRSKVMKVEDVPAASAELKEYFNSQEFEEYAKKMFEEYDLNGDGTLETDETLPVLLEVYESKKDLFKMYKIPQPTRLYAQQQIKRFDQNQNGKLEEAEFLRLIKNMYSTLSQEGDSTED